MNSQEYLYQIGLYLAWFESQVAIENGTNYFDINKHAERFLIPILNEVFKGKFERLEYEDINYPAVDLGDKGQRIAVQVTSETGYGKITRTIDGFITYKKYRDFDQLYHIIIDKDFKTSKKQEDVDNFITQKIADLKLNPAPKVPFDLKENVWNISKLKSEIEQKCNTEELAKIAAHLRSEYGRATELPSFNDLLVPYRTAFDTQLDKSTKALSYQLHNAFFGRKAVLEEFEAFAVNEAEKVLVVVAEGGYGKTRLCIEYFEKFVDEAGDRIAYVLVPPNFNPAAFTEALQTDKKIFILFDDAHTDARLLNQLIPIINRHQKAKLILTVRGAAYNDTINSIASHQRNHVKIALERLDYDETKALFKSQLPWAKSEQVVSLTTRSNGVPIVILAMADALNNGIAANEITEDEAFTQYVLESKKQAVELVHEKIFIDKDKINKTIQLLSLVSPVENNEKEIKQLADLNQVTFDETEIILETLHEIGFIERKPYSIAVKPDPYSDIILLESVPRIRLWLQNPLSAPFKERIVKNLMLVEHSDKLKLNLTAILSDFVTHLVALAKDENHKGLLAGLETLLTFTYKKPGIAISVLEHLYPVLSALKQPDPADFWSPSRVKEINETVDKIFSIALLNSHGHDTLKNGFDLLVKYVEKRGNTALLSSAFRYRMYDFYEFRYRPVKDCERQEFLLTELEQRAKNNPISDIDQELILNGIGLLLRLDFNLEEFYEAHSGQFTYGVANVPENETVKDIRARSLAALFEAYPKFSQERKDQVIERFATQLHFMRAPKEKKDWKYDQTADLKMIVPFLLKLIESGEIGEKRSSLLRKMDIYKKAGLKPEFEDDFNTLHDALTKVGTVEERMVLFLDHDYFYVKENTKVEVEAVVAELGDPQKFYELLLAIKDANSSIDRAQNIGNLTQTMTRELPELATGLFNYVIENKYKDAGHFSHLIKASYTDVDDFYKKVEYFWGSDDPKSKATAIWMLIFGRNGDDTYLKESDLDYFEQVLADGNKEAIDNLKFGLHNYFLIAPERSLELLDRLFKADLPEPAYHNTFQYLFENEALVKSNPELLKNFLFDKTIAYPLDHYFEDPLQFLEDYFGFTTVIDYLVAKEKYFNDNPEFPGLFYDFKYHNPKIPAEQHEQNFSDLISRLIYDKVEDLTKLLEILKPVDNLSENFKNLMRGKIAEYEGDKEKLFALAHLLRVFGEPNEHYLALLVEIGNLLAGDRTVTDKELVSIFPEGFYYNFGSRSKTGHGPFPQDVKKKVAIEKLMAENELHDRMKPLFANVLLAVNKSIDEENKRTDEW